MAFLYILYSKSIDTYYIGSCKDMDERMLMHKEKTFQTSFTKRADDWELFLVVSDLNYKQARDIEKHIKKMKSRKYINDLKKYPEILKKLKLRYR